MTFGCQGVPETVVSDNGPRGVWSICHTVGFFSSTSPLPHYQQANGKAESTVKICKALLKKARVANSNVHLALLNHRNTPTEPRNASPAQRLFVRRTRTLLPMSAMLLKPKILQEVQTKLKGGQHKQAERYKKLAPLNEGDSVQMRLPGSTMWTAGSKWHHDHT